MNLSLKIILPVFIIVGLVQWLVPAQMIWKHEEVLQKGTTFRFLTEPVDPANPFMGKYITLNFKEETAWAKKGHSLVRDQTIYVLIKNDSAGFASINGISSSAPTNQQAYVKAKVRYLSTYGYSDSVEVNIDYPFDEFYMGEHKAPKAEEAYRKANLRGSAQRTYAEVKIYKGAAVTENVYIDNKPLSAYFK